MNCGFDCARAEPRATPKMMARASAVRCMAVPLRLSVSGLKQRRRVNAYAPQRPSDPYHSRAFRSPLGSSDPRVAGAKGGYAEPVIGPARWQAPAGPVGLAHPTCDSAQLKSELSHNCPEAVWRVLILRTQHPNRPPPGRVAPIRARSEPNLLGIACRDVPPCRDTWPHDQGRSRIPISCLTFWYRWPSPQTGIRSTNTEGSKFKGSKMNGRAGWQGQAWAEASTTCRPCLWT